jgi:hypothetical protein
MRQLIGNGHTIAINQDPFTFASHRMELDLPIQSGKFKLVPYVAGTFGYDDRSGFTRSLVDGSDTGSPGNAAVGIGEAGIRASMQPLWKVYPNVKSRLWDVNGLRHIIQPRLALALFAETDSAVQQRNTLNFGISQRLQTKRRTYGHDINNLSVDLPHSKRKAYGRDTNSLSVGVDSTHSTSSEQADSSQEEKMRTVEWMRLDTDFTLVDHSDAAGPDTGPDMFIWNQPMVPLQVMAAPEIFNGDLSKDLQRFEMFGPRRNYFSANYLWHVSDSTVVLSNLNYDLQSNWVQQFDFGLTHLCWPNLSLYIGDRYLRQIEVLDQKGSNAFTFAATYTIDPRYTIVFAEQYDFDYHANIQSEITLIRRYHRIQWAITYNSDESINRHAIVFSIWPEGVEETAIGPRRYTGLGRAGDY